jgi:hypothetical protein
MYTIAHRGNVFGKSSRENELFYLLKAVKAGFGVETDVLRAPCGRLIISHDPTEWTSLNDAELTLKNLILNNAFIALNIKEEGILEDLLKIINPSEMRGFVFDFELCCSDPLKEMQAYNDSGFKIAERCSDRGEKPLGGWDYIWLDEMDKSNSLSIFMLNLDPKKIIYVSPELHGRPVEERRKERFYGICTDFCMTL